MAKHKTKPYLGTWSNQIQTDDAGSVGNYVDALMYYRPRGFSKLAREGKRAMIRLYAGEAIDDVLGPTWFGDCEFLLTEWARRVERHGYVFFGPHSGDIGFYIDHESARADSDLLLNAGDSVPKGFTGQVFFVNDHGNCTCEIYSRGRKNRELFSIV